MRTNAFFFAAALSAAILSPCTVSAADAIEPGSPESFWYWCVANVELVDNLLSDASVLNWSQATINYACDIKSLLDAYQLWYDNQDMNGDGVPALSTQYWLLAVRSPNTREVITLPTTITGYYGSSIISTQFRTSRQWASMPYGSYYRSNAIPHLVTGSVISSTPSNQRQFMSFPAGTTNLIGMSSARDIDNMQAYLYNKAYNATGLDDNMSIPPNADYRMFLYSPGNLDGMGLHYQLGDNLQDLYQSVVDKHPDADTTLVDIPPPVDDVTWAQEPTEPTHPGGCQCEVHVVVTVDVNHEDIDWPTYNVTDVPEPSDFDLSVIPTVAESDIPDAPDMSLVPDGLIGGVGFWWSQIQSFIDFFDLLPLVLVVLSFSTVLYLISR